MPAFRTLITIMIIGVSTQALARWEWVVIETGTYSGQGMDRDRFTAIDECSEMMDSAYVAAAQRCCENSDTEQPDYQGRCAAGAASPRSFSGSLRAYFCWPTAEHAEYFPATGYYYVYDERPYSCSELMDLAQPEPSPTPIASPSPTPYPSVTPAPFGFGRVRLSHLPDMLGD